MTDAAYQHAAPHAGASFTYRVLDLERFPFLWHFHPEHELTMIVSGRGRRHVGDHVDGFGPGDLVLVGSELPHSWVSTGAPARSSAIVVQFAADFLGDALLERRELYTVRALLAAAAPGLAFPQGVAGEARRLLPAMAGRDGLGRLVDLLSALGDLATAMPAAAQLASAGYRPAFDASARQRIADVCAFIGEHHAAPLSLGDVAAVAHMTPSAFSRAFRRATGRTFTEHVNEVRVGAACRLLIETELPVAAIAFECGFRNLANFNRRFRALRSATPTAYRAAFTSPAAARSPRAGDDGASSE